MHLPRHILTFLSLISFTLASDHRFEHDYVEDGVVDDLTFGNDASIWAKDHRHITGWSISGTGYTPKLHSDRIVLTPPWPGSRRGAVWADHAVESSEWEAEFEFRATGPDNGNGNLQFWYVRSEPLAESVGSSSVYTVGKFDGVAVVVSQSGNKGGTVRAFLNDGSLSFRDHHKVDDLSFGQCDFQYRNLGKFSKIKVKRTYWTFKVEVDGKSCINTYSIHLPHNYHFGITAASSETPDSFEVRSFIVHKLKEGEEIVHDHGPSYKPDWHNYDDESEQWKHDAQDVLREHAVRLNHGESRTQGNTPVPSHDHSTTKDSHREGNKEWHWTSGSEHIADAEASQYTSESERFKDLHDRVTLLNHQADLLYNDLTLWRKQLEKYREEVMGQLHTVDGDIDSSRHMIEGIERDVQAVKNDVQALKSGLGSQDLKEFLQQLPRNEDLKELLRQLHWALSDNHLSLRDAIVGNSPRLNLFAFLIVASNVLMLASYVVYVKRREGQPKKYL